MLFINIKYMVKSQQNMQDARRLFIPLQSVWIDAFYQVPLIAFHIMEADR